MKCVFCKEELHYLYVLVPVFLPDGSLQAFACLKCSKEQGVYCDKHERPHIGFEDKTTACILCIDDGVNLEMYRARELMEKVSKALPRREMQVLMEMVTCAATLTRQTKELTLLRWLVIKANRVGKSIDQVLEDVARERTVASLIGERFLRGMIV